MNHALATEAVIESVPTSRTDKKALLSGPTGPRSHKRKPTGQPLGPMSPTVGALHATRRNLWRRQIVTLKDDPTPCEACPSPPP